MLQKKISNFLGNIFRNTQLTTKITIWYSTFIIGLLTLLVVGSFFVINQVSENVSKRDLVDSVTKVASGSDRFTSFDDGIYFAQYNKDNNIVSGAVPSEFGIQQFSENSVTLVNVGDKQYYYYDVKITSATFFSRYNKSSREETSSVVASDVEYIRGVVEVSNIKSELRMFPIGILIISPLLIAIIVYGGYLIVRRALKPIKIMSDTAKYISQSGNLAERVNLPKGKDELHQLAVVVNNMLDSVENSYNREKKFSSDVSHELRTPVSVIVAESEYGLKYAESLDEAKDSLGVIDRQAKRMTTMINQILEMSRLDQLENIEKQEINFSEVLRKMLSDYNTLIISQNLIIEENISDDVVISGNIQLLQRLVDNLLLNAVKFAEGKIKLSLANKEHKVIFSISDDGPGVADEEKENIWQRFYKVDQSRTNTENQSSGLGLSLVKKIVELHCGEAKVKDSGMGGALFEITFDMK